MPRVLAPAKLLVAAIVAVVALCAASPRPAVAQDERWLSSHKLANRYEGFLDRPNGSHNFELLGFYGYRDPSRSNQTDVLHVDFFLPVHEPVYLEARELQSHSQYYMKAIKIEERPGDWSHFSDWPVGDVLYPNHIDVNNLGVLIRLKSPNEYTEDLAPAILYTLLRPKAIEDYTLFLTAYQMLSGLQYELTTPNGWHRRCTVSAVQKSPCTANEPFAAHPIAPSTAIKVWFASAGIPPQQPVTIRLFGHYANSDETLNAQFRFFNASLQ